MKPAPSLWDRPAPSKRGALATSREQGERIAPTTALKRYAILVFLQSEPLRSWTADEISKALGWSHMCGRPRVSECVKVGWLEMSGTRRETEWGGTAAGLRLSPRGLRALRVAMNTDGPVVVLEGLYREARGRQKIPS